MECALNIVLRAPQKALPLLFSAQMRPIPGGPHSPDLVSSLRLNLHVQQIPNVCLVGSHSRLQLLRRATAVRATHFCSRPPGYGSGPNT